jgi:hypothetical protein
VKGLLVMVLCISSVGLIGVTAGCATRQIPKTEAERKVVPAPATTDPRLEIPRNCKQTQNADGSVLMTCDCGACGHPEPRDGMNSYSGKDVTILWYPAFDPLEFRMSWFPFTRKQD